MDINELIIALNNSAVDFKEVMQVIDKNYNFTPCLFKNGQINNAADTNNGSCKIFAFGKLNNLSEQATLNAFGEFYTLDVLKNPTGNDHQNIRNFMQFGWQGIEFEEQPLKLKQ